MTRRTHIHKKSFSALILLSAAAISLGGCGLSWDDIGGDIFAPDPSDKRASAPPSTPAPPDPLDNLQPLEARQGGATGVLGLNLTNYFNEDLKTLDERVERLERVILAMHNDLKVMVPPLQRFANIESDLKNMIAANKTTNIHMNAPMDTPATATTAPQPLLVQDQAAAPVQPSSLPKAVRSADEKPLQPGPRAVGNGEKQIVTGVRVGEHPDRVRLVFDVTADTAYTADLDNEENILLVELPHAAWEAPMQEPFGKMNLMKSYKVDPGSNGGYLFILQLKGPSSILSKSVLPAISGGGKRIVIDLKK